MKYAIFYQEHIIDPSCLCHVSLIVREIITVLKEGSSLAYKLFRNKIEQNTILSI